MNHSLIVTIPLTVTLDLSPNGRVHWRTKHQATQAARAFTVYALVDAIKAQAPTTCFDVASWPLTLNYTIGLGKGRRTLDDDNAIACMKPVRDAIADTVGIDDKHFRTGTVTQIRDPEQRGFVRVEIVAAEALQEAS